MPMFIRRRSLTRVLWILVLGFLARLFFSSSAKQDAPEIRRQGVLDLVSGADRLLDVQKHDFLQVRMGRDERPDFYSDVIFDGVEDFWDRFQKPYITDRETAHMDEQAVLAAIEQLLTLNGWVAALCPMLSRPFGQADNAYDDLIGSNHLYFVGMAIHSADHFLVDQLAVIVQLARRLGSQNMFVSMLDYDSSDSTETLLDLCEAVLTLLGVPFRIRRVLPMTEDPSAAYYPLEEAHMRNLALEPLFELLRKRRVRFHRVVWLKGFTCPNDILETIAVSDANGAAMVCGMDWAEQNGFFIFSDRWRTRDIAGDQFRQSRSSAAPAAGPPRDAAGAKRYAQHLPFQVFCCESGTHVVDPAQSYYRGITYRSGTEYANLSTADAAPRRPIEAPCLDSSQAYFCRDLWVDAAKEGVQEEAKASGVASSRLGGLNLGFGWGAEDSSSEKAKKGRKVAKAKAKRAVIDEPAESLPEPIPGRIIVADNAENAQDGSKLYKRADEGGGHAQRQRIQIDADANAGSDYDAMPDADAEGEEELDSSTGPVGGAADKGATGESAGSQLADDVEDATSPFSIPNSVFRPARILVNPRCVTTYAGVSHTQLALDLFGPDKDEDEKGPGKRAKYVLDDWEGAPESFVCQEQRYTGGRKAPKTQRRLPFSIQSELERTP